MTMRRLDDVHLNSKVLMDELGRIGVVRIDSADPRCRQKYILGPVLAKKGFDSPLIDEIKLGMTAREKIDMSARSEASHKCRACQPAVTGNIDLRFKFKVQGLCGSGRHKSIREAS